MATCVIIGPGGKLGEAIARRFGHEGLELALVGRNPDRLAEQAAALARSHIQARTYHCELTDIESLLRCLDATASEGETPECLVYNAAMVRTGTALESSPADLAASIAVNALGAHAAAQRFGPAMKQRGRGSILLTGGGLALHPESGYSELSIGKAALRALALCLAGEVAPDVKLAILRFVAPYACTALWTPRSLLIATGTYTPVGAPQVKWCSNEAQ
jgi:short-subunit dehydrogenase